MTTTRRGFILAAGSLALVHLLSKAQGLWRSSAGAAAPALRPEARASVRTLCAHCGVEDHGTLDPGCPAVAAIAAARQVSARGSAAQRPHAVRVGERGEA